MKTFSEGKAVWLQFAPPAPQTRACPCSTPSGSVNSISWNIPFCDTRSPHFITHRCNQRQRCTGPFPAILLCARRTTSCLAVCIFLLSRQTKSFRVLCFCWRRQREVNSCPAWGPFHTLSSVTLGTEDDVFFLPVVLITLPTVAGTNLHERALRILSCASEGPEHFALWNCVRFVFHLASAEAAGLFLSGSGDEVQIQSIFHLNRTHFFFSTISSERPLENPNQLRRDLMLILAFKLDDVRCTFYHLNTGLVLNFRAFLLNCVDWFLIFNVFKNFLEAYNCYHGHLGGIQRQWQC